MTATPDLDAPLIETIERHCRQLMSDLAATPNRYPTRGKRAELLVEVNAELDNWLRLHRCG